MNFLLKLGQQYLPFFLVLGGSLLGARTSLAQSGRQVTYSEHIAPIIAANCATCHKPNGAAPFSLLTYADVARHATTVQKATEARYMPPWKADPHYSSFANERRLSPEQIALIKTWVEAGAPQGRDRKLSKAEQLRQSPLGQPDLVLRPKAAFRIKGNGQENFVLFKIPFELSADQPIRALEFVANNKQLLHHANYAVQSVGPEVDIYQGNDMVESDQFLTNMQEFKPLMREVAYYGGWIPGSTTQDFPSGVGFTMPKRGVILLTVHYGPSAIDTTDWSTINVYFAKAPIKREIKAISIGSAGVGNITPPLIIPADSVKKFRVELKTAQDLSVLYVWPHMHLLGKSFKAWATTPAGEQIPLVSIPDWDFRWQEAYRFRQMQHLPQGSVITVEGQYDNTAANPNNPFSPPQRIISQDLMETRSEMLNLIMLFLPYQPGDETRAL
ncbi:c-type cytochrome [Hymenobacter persicinus]|uniref:Cytochrome c n=1 Tax=Hymenobacter persicinus TaxID=2025506 RepID=A0A4Q5LBQ0_9BACT|nr:cytochrome c [Hymenobacter persicinus]RYU79930.1 cytochrome c [Hymenobacter persicinus]